ncbi:MAG: catechol-2,3-dioxygenase, partial [Kiritimatiellia bacterium]
VPEAPGALEVTFNLFRIPDEKGFHVIGSDDYVHLQAKPVRAYGNNIKSLYGLKEVGDASVDGSELRIVYHGTLRLDQLMALDITLHSLSFEKRAELVGVTARDVPINLYVADQEIPIEVARLKSRNDYLLRTTEPLDNQRVYALTTNGLLNPIDDEAFQRIAPPLRLAFPVELR